MARTGPTEAPDGWAGELANLFQRLKATSGVDSATGKPPSLRQLAVRAGYAPSHVRDVLNGTGRPSPDAVAAVAGALNATEQDRRLAIFYAEQLQRSPCRRRVGPPSLSSRTARPVPRELPHDVRDFAGRDSELEQLDRSATSDATAGTLLISAIDGIAGVGKTALAVRFAHRIADRFPDGQLHVNLRGFDLRLPPLDPHTVLEDFLRSLGIDPVQIPAGAEDRIRLYRSVIADLRILLLLDNAATAEQVRPLLPAANGCLALVTSRNRLSGLVTRDGARRLAVDVLTPVESLSLLAAIAGNDRVRADPDAAAQVAGLAGHLPLALRILGERLSSRNGLTARDLLAELTDERSRLNVLTAAGDEHLAVRAVFSLSYRQLPELSARAFRLLGLHRGADISVEAAAALAASTADQASSQLEELVAANLLETDEPGRYRFHDLLRVYAAERADAEEPPEERSDAVRRLLTWYLYSADASARILEPGYWHFSLEAPEEPCRPKLFTTRAEALLWFEAERANLIPAIQQAVASCVPAIAWQLPAALTAFYHARSCWADWSASLEIGLAGARSLEDRSAEGSLLSRIGSLHLLQRQFDTALEYLQASRNLLNRIGDRRGECFATTILADAHLGLGHIDEAVVCSRTSITLARECDEPQAEARATMCLSLASQYRGRYDEALVHSQRAAELWSRAGSQIGKAWNLHNLGTVHRHLGHPNDAVALCHQSLSIRREIGDRPGEAATLHSLGKALIQAGRTDKAHEVWTLAVEIFESLGDPKAAAIQEDLTLSKDESMRVFDVRS